jgi:hypothetical protein
MTESAVDIYSSGGSGGSGDGRGSSSLALLTDLYQLTMALGY